MKKINYFLFLFFIAAFLLSCSNDESVVDRGTCGDNLTWTLTKGGVLTISGSGTMYNYDQSYGNPAPWYSQIYKISSIIIANGVSNIGREAFYCCSNLKFVTIPYTVKSIGAMAFLGCYSLTSIVIPDYVTSIENGAFESCASLTSVSLGNSVISIGNSAFERCFGLSSIEIPDHVTSIGNNAFFECSGLTTLTIGSCVTSIGSCAFMFCKGLVTITSHAITPPVCGFTALSSVDKSIPIYVPEESVNSYQSADTWKSFNNILPLK